MGTFLPAALQVVLVVGRPPDPGLRILGRNESISRVLEELGRQCVVEEGVLRLGGQSVVRWLMFR